MSRVDWDAMVAHLTGQRETVVQELEDIDAVLATVRERAHGTPAPKPAAKANGRTPRRAKWPGPGAKAATTAAAKPAPSGKLSADQVVRMGELYEGGKPADEIATRFKITTAAVYYYVKSRKWKRPKDGAAAPAAAAPAKQPAGEQLAGSVKCTSPECGVMTDYDPCRRCGVKLNRKGW